MALNVISDNKIKKLAINENMPAIPENDEQVDIVSDEQQSN